MDKHLSQNPRIITRNLLEVSGHLRAFKKRHAKNTLAHGFKGPNGISKNYLFDAVRFSHKMFAQYDAIINPPWDVKGIVWMDGDTVTHTAVPPNFLTENFPVETKPAGELKKFGIYYLGREHMYTETGWMIYNRKADQVKEFWEACIAMYTNDTIFRLEHWTDCHVFDHTRKIFEKKGLVTVNVTKGFARGHPFINCVLGEYMDHTKGERKKHGRSKKHERHVKTKDENIDWWSK